MSCGTCRFWKRDRLTPPREPSGWCRRYPPAQHGTDPFGRWPRTFVDDTCGEFRPSDPSAVEVAPGVWAVAPPRKPEERMGDAVVVPCQEPPR